MEVKFKKRNPDAIPFQYTREDDACMDVFSLINKTLLPKETAIIPTGISLEIPNNYEGIIRGRSGLSSKGIQVYIGTIESSYRGDIGVIITNNSDKPFEISKGNRIAQFTIKPVIKIQLIEFTSLSDTERGENGYGSSGY